MTRRAHHQNVEETNALAVDMDITKPFSETVTEGDLKPDTCIIPVKAVRKRMTDFWLTNVFCQRRMSPVTSPSNLYLHRRRRPTPGVHEDHGEGALLIELSENDRTREIKRTGFLSTARTSPIPHSRPLGDGNRNNTRGKLVG